MYKEDIGKWRQIVEETKELSTIEVPRYIGGKNSQLICFCDASEDSYATAIYLKTMDEERKSRVNLIFSKARITPKRAMSIPRLELMALLIRVRSLSLSRRNWVWKYSKNYLKKFPMHLKLVKNQETCICIREESNYRNYKREERWI